MFTTQQWVGIIAVYVFSTVLMALAAAGDFMIQLAGAAGFMAVGLFLALAGGLIGRRKSQRGATIGIIVGYGVYLVAAIL